MLALQNCRGVRLAAALVFTAVVAAASVAVPAARAAEASPAPAKADEWTDERIKKLESSTLDDQAHAYLFGWNGPPDYDLADRMFEELHARGKVKAYEPALTFLKVPGQGERVVKWFVRSGGDGDYLGYEFVGSMYMDGDRIPRNYALARKYFALSPTALSEVLLADLVLKGLGGPGDPVRAETLYRDAAWRGNGAAAAALATINYSGAAGHVDYVEAYAWVVVAVEFDVPNSLSRMNKLSESMSAAEREKARTRGQEYLARARRGRTVEQTKRKTAPK